MSGLEETRDDFIQTFGEAYVRFGAPRLHGRIVGLLLSIEGPMSLDEIASTLAVTKGPVSQALQRLRETNIVERLSQGGERKDYYRSHPNAFINSYMNRLSLIEGNVALAARFIDGFPDSGLKTASGKTFLERIHEMHAFYGLMLEHEKRFMAEWKTMKSNSRFLSDSGKKKGRTTSR